MHPLRIAAVLTLLTACAALRSYAAPSGRKLAQIGTGFTESANVRISPSGRFLAMPSCGEGEGCACPLFDTVKRELIDFRGQADVVPICFVPGRDRIWVSASSYLPGMPGFKKAETDSSHFALYDLRARRFLRAFPVSRDVDRMSIWAYIPTPGRMLHIPLSEGQSQFFDTKTGKVYPGKVVSTSHFSSDGAKSKYLRTSDGLDHIVKRPYVDVMRAHDNVRLKRIYVSKPHLSRTARPGVGLKAQLSTDVSQVAIMDGDAGRIFFHNAVTGHLQWSAPIPPGDYGSSDWAWSPDGRSVGFNSRQGFQVRNAKSGVLRAVAPAFSSEPTSDTFLLSDSSLFVLKNDDTGFGPPQALWQWRLHPTAAQRRADALYMRRLRARENKFALAPKHIGKALAFAVGQANAPRAQFLLQHGASARTLSQGKTMLETVLWKRYLFSLHTDVLPTLRILVAHGANPHIHAGALMTSSYRDPEVISFLLDHGVSIDARNERDEGQTVLHIAAFFCDPWSVHFLLAHGANPNSRDIMGLTPLTRMFYEARQDNLLSTAFIPVARLLLRAGADVNAKGSQGQTALSMTKDPALRKFLERAGAK